jgi:hypothetical protein
MKTFKQILDYIYSQPEADGIQTAFEDYSEDQKLAVLFALDETWEEYDYKFKESSTTFNTVASQAAYDLPYGKIQEEGLKESLSSSPMAEIKNANYLSESTGKPTKYYIKSNKLYLYPTPDAAYTINLDYLTDYKATDGAATPVEKDTLELETDVLNIPDYIENHFLITLAYKTTLNKLSDPTDEVYTHALANYNNALSLLKIKSNRSASPPRFV